MKLKEENNCLPDDILQCFVDGELSTMEKELVKEHLYECEHCQSNFQETKDLIGQLSDEFNLIDDDEIFIPPFQSAKVINAPKNRKKRKFYWWAAAAVLLFTIALNFLNDSGEKDFQVNYIFQQTNSEVDANKPWHEQTSTLYILDESGNIIDKIENL